jgi:nucleotide-binding universal stress UspA family protein
MYKKILVALDNSRADGSLLPHVAALAKLAGSELLLIHVADGFAARHFDNLKLAESEEMRMDRAYLEKQAERLASEGLQVKVHLALGNPPAEILKAAETNSCDLIAMTTHGHRFFADLIYGSTITAVRHKSQIPVLLVRAAEL